MSDKRAGELVVAVCEAWRSGDPDTAEGLILAAFAEERRLERERIFGSVSAGGPIRAEGTPLPEPLREALRDARACIRDLSVLAPDRWNYASLIAGLDRAFAPSAQPPLAEPSPPTPQASETPAEDALRAEVERQRARADAAERERDEARRVAKSYADDMLAISEGKNSGVWGGIAATAIRECQAATARAEQAEATIATLRAEVERLRREVEFAWKLPMAKKHRERLRAALSPPQASTTTQRVQELCPECGQPCERDEKGAVMRHQKGGGMGCALGWENAPHPQEPEGSSK